MLIRFFLIFTWLISASYSLAENQGSPGALKEGADFPPVGSVSLVIGRSFSKSIHNDEYTRLATGALLYEGDSLKTESSGHIHVQLRDSGVISIRPIASYKLKSFSSMKLILKHRALNLI